MFCYVYIDKFCFFVVFIFCRTWVRIGRAVRVLMERMQECVSSVRMYVGGVGGCASVSADTLRGSESVTRGRDVRAGVQNKDPSNTLCFMLNLPHSFSCLR